MAAAFTCACFDDSNIQILIAKVLKLWANFNILIAKVLKFLANFKVLTIQILATAVLMGELTHQITNFQYNFHLMKQNKLLDTENNEQPYFASCKEMLWQKKIAFGF